MKDRRRAVATLVALTGAAILLLALLLPACTSNPGTGGLLDRNGNHPAGFATAHGGYAGADNAPCKECHGADLDGGIANVSCFSASFDNLACHPNGPANHPANWVQLHGDTAALDNGASCKPCHGADLHGSATAPSCYLGSFDGASCHANGPAFHPPASWLDCTRRGPENIWHGSAYGNNTPICSTCHDVTSTSPKCTGTCHFTLGGGKVPPALSSSWSHGRTNHHQAAILDNAAVRAVCIACHDTHNRFGHGPVCHNCHGGENPHPDGWLRSHDTQARSSTASCATAECHGTSLQGDSGRACATCHKAALPTPPHQSDCLSCHGKPPAGTVPPNVAGAHDTHDLLPGVTALCTPCHTGLGMDSPKHFDNAFDVALPATWNARNGGPARYTASSGSCSGVSCHGGKATPAWRTGTLSGTGPCNGCHNTALATTSTAQWNDWTDGRVNHSRHVTTEGIACTACHSTARMADSLHFATLSTTAMSSADAIATLYTDLSYAGGGQECGGTRASGTGCHGGD